MSISAANSQKVGGDAASGFIPVVVLTHEAKVSDLEKALAEIEASGVVGAKPVKLRMI